MVGIHQPARRIPSAPRGRAHGAGSAVKKLRDAGSWWASANAGSGSVDDDTLDDAAYYQVSREAIAQAASREALTFAVWPENWEALIVFLDVADQWDYPPMGGKPFRLNAQAVFSWLELSGRKRQARELWPQIRLIAAGALDVWHAE